METPLVIQELSQVAQARQHAALVAQTHGFSEALSAKVALIVTEAATNLIKYAGGGTILTRPYAEIDHVGLEVLVLDRGPGMAHPETSARDGYSTGGTLGLGLGGIARASSFHEIYTSEKLGTAILARVRSDQPVEPAGRPGQWLTVSGLSVPKAGQESCGDAWATRWVAGALWVTAVDGLGHGPQAARAAHEAIRVFEQADASATPYDVIRNAHVALKATRGAVMAVAVIRPVLGSFEFAGIGNISTLLITPEEVRRLPSTDGTVGYSVRTIREQSYPWVPGSVLALSTDGLSTRWNLAGHPGLQQRHPALIASVIHRDFWRASDDATIVVVKDEQA
ncbi:SpoIIE family protein phosphatase [Achromobacter aloeverae]|uniref:Serine/threonine protein kinase n=1 Tax=Achromobacter aloeverae TaxID=1750518 RepID=A0A4Q1HDJ9_9BURK|nr:SpoIIE family protein phosphatase [Achromobacter aloeverae]RXN83281.1 serine/threonine protein kinase [Achromobacter aloeverae]